MYFILISSIHSSCYGSAAAVARKNHDKKNTESLGRNGALCAIYELLKVPFTDIRICNSIYQRLVQLKQSG